MKQIALMIVTTVFLVACGKTEQHHTVEWFKQAENKAVLEDTVKACANDPGGLGQSPNCVNAQEAYTQLMVEEISAAVNEDRANFGKK
ncbi:MAG: EexN family lipoprotein [Neisseriaceae bacterium]|nr:EexN family lipoprotein [Neisseriaceae bacterium]